MTHISQYIQETIKILELIDQSKIQSTVDLLIQLRARGGRLFILGVGGGAGHASHAVHEFRKVAATACGVVGRYGGYTARVAGCCVLMPVVTRDTVTPDTEAFQAVVWDLL